MDSNQIDRPDAPPDLPPGYELLRNEMGFSAHVGPFYVRKPRDGHRLAFAFRALPHHANRGGVVHGGMLVSFADHVLGAMCFKAAGNKPCSTITLDCSFVSPGRPGDWIECTGDIARMTRSVIFIDGRLFVGERVVLQAKGIWKLLDKPWDQKTK
ncbi:MAG: PaaI family thioesterase [Reyranellaceae bacterium]